jgi:predicted nucleotidyltransferase
MDQAEALAKATRFARLAREVVEADTAVLFGSYASGRAEEHSDVDVGLFVDRLDEEQDYLELLRDLYGIADRVDVHIEPHLFVRCDDRTGFAAEVEKKGLRVAL